MGQKANILTLRKNKQLLNTYKSNMYKHFNDDLFYKVLERTFENKGIMITAQKSSKNGNTNFIFLDTLYKTAKLIKYRKKVKHKLSPSIKKSLQKARKKRRYKILAKKAKNPYKILLKRNGNKNSYRGFLTILNKCIKSKLLVFKVNLLNKKVNKFVKYNLWKAIKKFKRPLFSRRFNLFYDFVKLSALFIYKQINLQAYCNILGTIFKFLMKKSHSKYFFFIRAVFHFLIKAPNSQIKGIKLLINGRLKGKLRAKSMKFAVGKLSTQSISTKNDLSKKHINTLYGCFGMTLWVNYTKDDGKKKEEENEEQNFIKSFSLENGIEVIDEELTSTKVKKTKVPAIKKPKIKKTKKKKKKRTLDTKKKVIEVEKKLKN